MIGRLMGRSGAPLRGGLLLGIRVALGLLYLWSGISKARLPYQFLENVYAYQITGPKSGFIVASVLPWIEISVGICLLGNLLTSGALLASTLLGILFVSVQGVALHRGLAIGCGCFGATGASSLIGARTLLRAIALAVASALAYLLVLSNAGDKAAVLQDHGRGG